MSARSVGMENVTADHFSTKWERGGDAIVVWLHGNADTAIHGRLKTFLESLDGLAKHYRVKETVFELQDLYFMNSSCLSLLLRMINSVMDPKSLHKYAVRFRSNPNLRWQKKSLRALHSYAPDIVVIE